MRQASCQYAVVADGHPPRHGHPCDRILRVFGSSREQIPAAFIMESALGRRCSWNQVKKPRREERRQGPHLGGAAWGENRALKTPCSEIPGHAPRLPPMAWAPVGMVLGRVSPDETRRRGDMGSNPLRLSISAGGSTSCTVRRSSVAPHGIGRCGSGLGEEIARGDAETRRHGL